MIDLNLILGWSNEQCGEYLKCLKSSESKISKKLITGTRTRDEDVLANEGEYLKRIVEVMKSVKGINKNDAVALVSKFGTFKGVCCEADEDSLSDINGLGATKVERLLKVINDRSTYKLFIGRYKVLCSIKLEVVSTIGRLLLQKALR